MASPPSTAESERFFSTKFFHSILRLKKFGELLLDIFGNFFGGGRRSGGSSRGHGSRGSNLRIKLKLNYEERGLEHAGSN